jgi:putative addiction module killer protein
MYLISYNIKMIEVSKYVSNDDKCPFDIWINKLKDRTAKAQIFVRINRLTLGNEGQWRSVGNEIRELKISTGKAYRIYYGWTGTQAVLLLCGGNKSTQSKDIEKAKQYWSDYNEQN